MIAAILSSIQVYAQKKKKRQKRKTMPDYD